MKYAASRRNIRASTWIERKLGFGALALLKPDLGGALDPPANLGAAVGYYEDRNCEAANAERDKLDADRFDYDRRCTEFDNLILNLEWPPEPIRKDLSDEILEIEKALLADPENDTFLKCRDTLLDWNLNLRERIDTTVELSYLEMVAQCIRDAIEKFSGVKQTCVLPKIENRAMWIRNDVGCR